RLMFVSGARHGLLTRSLHILIRFTSNAGDVPCKNEEALTRGTRWKHPSEALRGFIPAKRASHPDLRKRPISSEISATRVGMTPLLNRRNSFHGLGGAALLRTGVRLIRVRIRKSNVREGASLRRDRRASRIHAGQDPELGRAGLRVPGPNQGVDRQ